MRWLLDISLKHPWQVLVFVGVFTAWSVIQIPDLRLEVSARGIRVDNPQANELYHDTLRTFGSENPTVIFIQDNDLFEPGKLSAIRGAVRKIEADNAVSSTVSLFNTRHLRTVDGFIYTSPYLKDLPETRGDAERIKAAAASNPLVLKNLISADGTVMAVNVYFRDDEHLRGRYEERLQAIDEAIEPLRDVVQSVFHLGSHTIRRAISEIIWEDQATVAPLAIGVLVLSLGLTVGRFQAAVVPLVTATLSIVWTLGIMAALGIALNLMTAIVPVLLLIIGSTEDIHLVSEYYAGRRRGLSVGRALEFMNQNMGMAIGLTFATTYLGFLSISANRLDILREFGLVASGGLALNFAATVLLAPLMLRYMRSEAVGSRIPVARLFEKAAKRLFRLTMRHRKKLIAGLLALGVIGAYWAAQLRVNNNIMDYFDQDSLLYKRVELLHDKLSGMNTFAVVLSGTAGTFLQVPYLEMLQDLQEYIEGSHPVDKSFSFADFVGVIHAGIDGERNEPAYLPDSNDVVRGYMALLDQATLKPFVSSDFSTTRIVVRHNVKSSSELNQAIEQIAAHARDWLDPGLELAVTGESYLNSQAVDYMADGQVRSLLLVYAVIFLVISLLFMRLMVGAIAVLVNLFPIVILFGIMGFFGMAIDVGTAMVGAITIGVCVDHTMHFLVRYRRLCRKVNSETRLLYTALKQEAMPIAATAISVAAGLAALTLSTFPPVARFGALGAMVMLLSLVGTFLIIPLILQGARLITVWDVLSVRLRSDVIEKCRLFEDMHQWQVRKLIAISEVKKYRPDEAIIRQGKNTEGMVVLLQGAAEVWRTRSDGSALQLETLTPGMGFGENALVARGMGMADVVATDVTKVLFIDWHDIERIARTFPVLASKLYKNIATIIATRAIQPESVQAPFKDQALDTCSEAYFEAVLELLANVAKRQISPLAMLRLRVASGGLPVKDHQRLLYQQLVRTLASTIKREVRVIDLVAHPRENEFLLLLVNTSLAEAEVVARRTMNVLTRSKSVPALDIDIAFFELERNETHAQFLERVEGALDWGRR